MKMPHAYQVRKLVDRLAKELGITSENKRLLIFAVISEEISDWHEDELKATMEKNIIDLEEQQSREFGGQ